MRPLGARVLKFDSAVGVHSEHDLKEQSDAQIIVSRFPFRGEGCGIDAFGVDEYIAASRQQRYGIIFPPSQSFGAPAKNLGT